MQKSKTMDLFKQTRDRQIKRWNAMKSKRESKKLKLRLAQFTHL